MDYSFNLGEVFHKLGLAPLQGFVEEIVTTPNEYGAVPPRTDFREFGLRKTLDREKSAVTLRYAQSCPSSFDDECIDSLFDAHLSGWFKCPS